MGPRLSWNHSHFAPAIPDGLVNHGGCPMIQCTVSSEIPGCHHVRLSHDIMAVTPSGLLSLSTCLVDASRGVRSWANQKTYMTNSVHVFCLILVAQTQQICHL